MTELPESLRTSASLAGDEYAWPLDAFLAALDHAAEASLACLGGQFQFRLLGATREMYWLGADSGARRPNEAWPAYVQRARAEVRAEFERIVGRTDFLREAKSWPAIGEKLRAGAPLGDVLYFCAYFVSEGEDE